MDFKIEVLNILKNKLPDYCEKEIEDLIEVPKNNMGDFAFPCFKLAKQFKKSPNLIASELCEKLELNELISEVKAIGPYINFFVNSELFIKQVIANVLKYKDDYGKSNIGNGKMIVIDYSSPNIAKPFHIGHLRSTVIGNSINNIYKALGYKTFGINYLGDWGTQFGKLIVAYKKWGDKEAVLKDDIKELVRLYVLFHENAEKDNSLNDEARNWIVKMENGDEEALQLWKWFKDISLLEFNRIYKMLDVHFDSYNGEAFYNDKMDKPVQELKEKGLLVESDGAKIVDLSQFNMPPCLILRSDGGTLYHTRDLASALYRKKTYNFHKAIYVTGEDQKLHFSQLFNLIKLMGYDWHKDMHHVSFGLVTLEDGKISTRKGRVVLMEEILNEAINKTLEIIENKNPTLENKEQVAKDVGIGAVIFNDLFNGRNKNIVFSLDKMLNFDGETGPYVQYTIARANSVLNKVENLNLDNINFTLINDTNILKIMKLIQNYNDKLIEASNKLEPFIITRHVVEIAKSFNKFYHDNVILVDDKELQKARIAVTYVTKQVLTNGLAILGINAPIKM